MPTQTPALLVLEDGTVFRGVGAGAPLVAPVVAEVVFNTSMCGYQELLTDPSYAGQALCLTAPHVGNYGVNPVDNESSNVQAAGLIVRQLASHPSSFRSEGSLADWLAEAGVSAITDVDTRALTRRIREAGVMMGAIVADGGDALELAAAALAAAPAYGDVDWVGRVRVPEARTVLGRTGAHGTIIEYSAAGPDHAGSPKPHIVVLDYGVKHSILRHLVRRGFAVTALPGNAPVSVLDDLQPDGVLISNGPGDPARLDACLPTVRHAVERFPTLGICLGHQLIARAFGATTFKLRFGHRGPNQPVLDTESGRVHVTSQNHGYAVDLTGADRLEPTQVNLNDQTVEALRVRDAPTLSVQYHPEAGPGPHDAVFAFDEFAELVRLRG